MTTLILGKNTVPFVNLAVRVLSAAGSPGAADSNPTAAFYRVDPNSGSLALDLLVGTSGYMTLAPVPGLVGVYDVAVPVSELAHPQYQVHVSWMVVGSARSEIQTLMFLRELDMISSNSPVPTAASEFAALAPESP